MEIHIRNFESVEPAARKQVEVIKLDGKVYVQMDGLEQDENLLSLADSLSAEMIMLHDRIKVLEERLRMLETESRSRFS
jgi:hypothetical protein